MKRGLREIVFVLACLVALAVAAFVLTVIQPGGPF